jgi:hypothetical protein
MDVGVHEARRDEQPAQHKKDRIRGLRHHGEQDQHIEEKRRLELIVVGVADLSDPGGPIRLAKRDRIGRNQSTPDRPQAQELHPEQQHEGERDLREHRHQHGLHRH